VRVDVAPFLALFTMLAAVQNDEVEELNLSVLVHKGPHELDRAVNKPTAAIWLVWAFTGSL
jgi:hypothetical protein